MLQCTNNAVFSALQREFQCIHWQTVTKYIIFESIANVLVRRSEVTRLRLHLRNNNIASLEFPKHIWLLYLYAKHALPHSQWRALSKYFLWCEYGSHICISIFVIGMLCIWIRWDSSSICIVLTGRATWCIQYYRSKYCNRAKGFNNVKIWLYQFYFNLATIYVRDQVPSSISSQYLCKYFEPKLASCYFRAVSSPNKYSPKHQCRINL